MKAVTYPNLRAEMRRYGIRQKDIADTLGLATETVNQKMGGKYPFTSDEMTEIKLVHFPKLDIEYLSTKKLADEPTTTEQVGL